MKNNSVLKSIIVLLISLVSSACITLVAIYYVFGVTAGGPNISDLFITIIFAFFTMINYMLISNLHNNDGNNSISENKTKSNIIESVSWFYSFVLVVICTIVLFFAVLIYRFMDSFRFYDWIIISIPTIIFLLSFKSKTKTIQNKTQSKYPTIWYLFKWVLLITILFIIILFIVPPILRLF